MHTGFQTVFQLSHSGVHTVRATLKAAECCVAVATAEVRGSQDTGAAKCNGFGRIVVSWPNLVWLTAPCINKVIRMLIENKSLAENN